MRQIQIFIIALLFVLCTCPFSILAQKIVSTADWNTPKILLVDHVNKRVFVNAGIDDTGRLILTKLPDKILVVLPEVNPESILVKFNSEKDAFFLGFNITDKGKNEILKMSDISNNSFELKFHKGELIQIGSRQLDVSRKIIDPVKIQIMKITETVSTASTEDDKVFPNTKKGPTKIQITEDGIASIENCILCKTIKVDCRDELPKDEVYGVRAPSWKRTYFQKKYPEIYSIRINDSIQWFGSSGDDKVYKISNTSTIHPIPGSVIRITMVDVDTSKIAVSADGESFFLEKKEDFVKQLEKGKNENEVKPEVKPEAVKPDSVKKSDTSNLEMAKVKDKEIIARAWKEKLIALDRVLEKFNSKFQDNRFLVAEKNRDLLSIQLGIKYCLHITLSSSNSNSLKLEISKAISREVDPIYWKALEGDVNNVSEEYIKAVNVKTNLAVFVKEIQVPDDDQVTIKINNLSNSKELIPPMTFNTRGGFKIDFSTGIFFTNLKNPEFVLTKSTFQYRDSRDTVVVQPGGLPKDSIIYSGSVKSASGNFIRENKNRLNYGAGVFMHAYRRSGQAFDWGISAGGLLNSTGEIYAALGLSLTLKSKFGRIGLIGGAIGGQEKRLSVSANDFVYKPEYEAYENGAKIFDNARQVPRFYESDSSEIPVYEDFNVRFFFGITFNIASINLK